MAGQHEVDRARGHDPVALGAGDVRDPYDEIGALAPQGLGLRLDGLDRWQELQVLGARCIRRLVVGRAGQPDSHAVDRDDRTILEIGQRLAVWAAQVGGIERKRRLRHALEKRRLAEIEFVVARHEDVGMDHVGQLDDVGATVDAGHQGGRDRVAAVRQDDVPALRPFRLHDGGEPRKSAPPLPVRHHDVGHQVDIVDQDERDPGGFGRGRHVRQENGEADEGGDDKAASGGHGLWCDKVAMCA